MNERSKWIAPIVIVSMLSIIISLIIYRDNKRLQTENMQLTHKPVVFIKGVILPREEDVRNPFRHSFVITNTGKMPARDLNVQFSLNIKAGTVLFTNTTIKDVAFESGTLYPNNEMAFCIPESIVFPNGVDKIEANFIINYSDDFLRQKTTERMKFIFSEDTNHIWQYVGPNVDIFEAEKKEREEKRKRKEENKK